MDAPLWILDAPMHTRMAERRCGRPSLAAAAEAAGHRVALATWADDRLTWDAGAPPPPGPAIVHGSFPFVAAVRAAGYSEPFATGEDTRFDMDAQQAWLGPRMLNAATQTRTLADLVAGPVPHEPVFLRPLLSRTDHHTKAFPGKPLPVADWTAFLDGLVAQGLPLDTDIVQAPLQPIHAEARHLIVAGRLVSSSLYRFQGALHVRIDSYPEQRALARAVARKANQPALAYMCDTAVVGDGTATPRVVKVVEMNPFSSSGLYGLDTDAVAAAFAAHTVF